MLAKKFLFAQVRWLYSPTSVKVKSNVVSGAIMPESNPPSSVLFSLTLCIGDCALSLVHVTAAPVPT
jgi:hypothetical protein